MNERGYIFCTEIRDFISETWNSNLTSTSFLSIRKTSLNLEELWKVNCESITTLFGPNIKGPLSERGKLKGTFIFPRRKSNCFLFQETENLKGTGSLQERKFNGQILFQYARRDWTGTFLPRSQENLTGHFFPLWRICWFSGSRHREYFIGSKLFHSTADV